MKISVGTKSLLFGAHQFILHPIIVAFCYFKLYGFSLDPRLWLCFIVHDWGYIGKVNMDGEEGKRHVYLGSEIIRYLFGDDWGDFCVYHSRYHAAIKNARISKLCVADKLAISYTPLFMYCKEELSEYVDNMFNGYESEYNLKCLKDVWKLRLNSFAVDYSIGQKEFAYGPSDYKKSRSKMR